MPETPARIEAKIAAIKTKLMSIGEMRPGSLSQQFKKPKEREGAFWQLNCTFQGKTSTEYVRPDSMAFIRAELKEYQRFRRLVDQWVAASILLSRLKKRKIKAE